MFKLGVYRLDQFQRPQSLHGRLSRNRVSFDLLRAAASPARTGEQVRLFEQVMPQIRLSNGVYRTTSKARFLEFDRFVNTVLNKHFEASKALAAQDWAASDCAASSEWAAALWSVFPNAHVTASDLELFLIEAALPDGKMFIWEKDGELLQYVRPPFVIRLHPPENKLAVVNRMLARQGRDEFNRLKQSWQLPEQWLRAPDAAPLELPPFIFRKIPLVHPEALRLRSGKFSIMLHSAFEALEHPCDAIRTMNIFNLKYFSQAKLEEGIEAVRRSLVSGGIWIVGRTFEENPPSHNASVLMKEGSGFRLLERFGKGSEIESLIPAV